VRGQSGSGLILAYHVQERSEPRQIFLTIHKISYYKVRVSTGSVETRWLGENIEEIIKIFHRENLRFSHTKLRFAYRI